MTSFFSGIVDRYTGYMENAIESNSPEYAKEKDQAREYCQNGALIATAVLVASAAFSAIGALATVAGGFATSFGVAILSVSLPMVYLSYNIYNVIENSNDVIDNPFKFGLRIGSSQSPDIDKPKLKAQLGQKTFFFQPLINYFVNQVAIELKKTVR